MLVEITADERATNNMILVDGNANGNSDELNVNAYNTVCFQITGILGGATVTFQASLGGGSWFNILATNVTSGVAAVAATANGIYKASCGGLKYVRAVVSDAATAVEQTETTNYTIVDATGVITFEEGHIPIMGGAVTADYVYTLPVVNEALGTGDAVEDTFAFANGAIVAESDVIKVDGVTKTRTVSYSIDNATGIITFVEAHIPAIGAAVTGSCTNLITVTGEAVGTGDGTTAVFTLDHSPITSQTIYADDTAINIKTVTTH